MGKKKNWNRRATATRSPGVFKRKEGGHLVRARVTCQATGRMVEIKRVLPMMDELTAYQWLCQERERVRAGDASVERPKTRFAEYAKLLFERKVKTKEIKSAKGRQKWATILEHLIAGTHGKRAGRHVIGFGEVFLDKLDVAMVERWRVAVAELIDAGDYAPATGNGWFATLQVILKAAKRELELPMLATEGIRRFDDSERDGGYSEEQPNALLPEEVGKFMAALRELYPQHYAMVFLGLATGLRPSSLRPLRRRGELADVLWKENRLLVRRSHSLGDEVMNTTKQRVKYSIHLPQEVVEILRWHMETQLVTPEQQESDLLFPGVHGGFRSPSVLNKPFADVVSAISLGKRLTQRGLRRTFNDLARAAEVESIVTRSISGHQTERMHHHYSTVSPAEQRRGIAKVIDIARVRGERADSDPGSEPVRRPTEPGSSSGASGGAPTAGGGATNEKAG